ncbi:MAG: hypothetical protein ACR2LM_02815 [Pyrinomonadaceae bacterium]
MHFFATRVSRLKPLKLLLAAFVIVTAVSTVKAQVRVVNLSVLSLAPAKVRIELASVAGTDWSFRNTYPGVVGLAERIENFQGADNLGRVVPVRKLAAGEFRFRENVTKVRYEVLLTPPSNMGDMSHVSWLNEEYGLLMLGDLLPEVGMGATPNLILNLELPPGWVSGSNRDPIAPERYLVTRPEQAVFAVGPALRTKSIRVGDTQIRIVTSSAWPFSDGAVSKIVAKILEEYTRILRHPLPGTVALLIGPFRGSVGPERWSAETRGQSVVLLLGRQGSSGALLGRLRVVLTHELFHLWVPNTLTLQGDYDWFFEGFTLYQALLTALRLRYITFEDYLATLARVYDSYRTSPERDKLSLLDASARRWTTRSIVYDKGMLVAFIYDLMLRRATEGRATVTDLYQELFRASTAKWQNANDVLISLLNRPNGMNRFSGDYVEGAAEIDLNSVLTPYGLDVETTGSITRLTVRRQINPEQRRLLKSLGYKR